MKCDPLDIVTRITICQVVSGILAIPVLIVFGIYWLFFI